MKKKKCSKCGKTKSVKEFYKRKYKGKNKVSVYICSWCKQCKAKWQKEYFQKIKPQIQKRRRVFYSKNKKKIAVANAKRDEKKGWEYRIKSRYGVTAKQYYIMLDNQNGGCWICGNIAKKRRLHIDHCHKSGKIRGLLCMRCNRGLSWFSDKPERLHKAADYLEQNG